MVNFEVNQTLLSTGPQANFDLPISETSTPSSPKGEVFWLNGEIRHSSQAYTDALRTLIPDSVLGIFILTPFVQHLKGVSSTKG
jgi:hypothetical protein